VVLGKVGVILDVQRRQRQTLGQTAGGDPRVVDRPGAPRRLPSADSTPQICAAWWLLSTSANPDNYASNAAWLRALQLRSLNH